MSVCFFATVLRCGFFFFVSFVIVPLQGVSPPFNQYPSRRLISGFFSVYLPLCHVYYHQQSGIALLLASQRQFLAVLTSIHHTCQLEYSMHTPHVLCVHHTIRNLRKPCVFVSISHLPGSTDFARTCCSHKRNDTPWPLSSYCYLVFSFCFFFALSLFASTHLNACRIAFHGRVISPCRLEDAPGSEMGPPIIYKTKHREGVVDRVSNNMRTNIYIIHIRV